MEQQLRRYSYGAVGFAFVVSWATLGATDAVLALIVCAAATNLHQLQRRLDGSRRRSKPERRSRRPRLATRPLQAEGPYQLVPDEPSLIISMQS